MMCGHCEARVKGALESIDGVSRAEVSFKDGTAIITTSKPVDEKTLKTAVEKEGYRFISAE